MIALTHCYEGCEEDAVNSDGYGAVHRFHDSTKLHHGIGQCGTEINEQSISYNTERPNELCSEVWKLFSQSSAGVPVLLPCAMLGELTTKKAYKTYCTICLTVQK